MGAAVGQETRSKALSENDDLFARSSYSIDDWWASERQAKKLLYRALADVLALYRACVKDSKKMKQLTRIQAEKGIRSTGSTKNPFTPIVKALFPEKESRTNLTRYASVLRFADSEGISPDGFAAFVKKRGGLVACQREDSTKHPQPRKGVAVDHEKVLSRMRGQAKLDLPKKYPTRYSSVFLEYKEGERPRLLGIRKETAATAKNYAPFET